MIRFLIIMLFCSLFSGVGHANAEEKIDLSKWSELPIAHEGRIKPIDSFARILLKKISGSEKYKNLHASEWLAEVIFSPSDAMEREIFKVTQPQVLHLEKRKNKRYSYIEIAESINKNRATISQLMDANDADWTPEQREMMRVFQNHIVMTQALRSLTAILPLPLDPSLDIQTNDSNTNTYLELKKQEKIIKKRAQKTVSKKGINIEKYNDEEIQIAELYFQFRTIEEGGENNILFKIYPIDSDNKHSDWLTPWEIILKGYGSPKSVEFINNWKEILSSYRQKNNEKFNVYVQKSKAITNTTSTIKIERIFNTIPSKNMAIGIYFLLSILLITTYIKGTNLLKYSTTLNTLFGTALTTHFLHIILRIIILDRPPVGTLYESVLFVSLICALIMFIISCKQKNEKRITSILIGSLSALSLLFISNGLVEDNKMTTLAAVLNTNFWLSTHVLCITIGYGFCLIAGLMSHAYLFQTARKDADKKSLPGLFKTILTVSIFALLFTGIGTILGGIWADQSWGRFWGWDPKENGALLIVLWLVWLLHSRISGHLHQLGFIVGMAFINIIVILAWFGVNLLNVGLHSYGFIEGIALSIGAFCFIEIILISTLAIKAKAMHGEKA